MTDDEGDDDLKGHESLESLAHDMGTASGSSSSRAPDASASQGDDKKTKKDMSSTQGKRVSEPLRTSGRHGQRAGKHRAYHALKYGKKGLANKPKHG